MTQLPDESGALWYDDEAGELVRPYTVTRGRTRSPEGLPALDVIALVSLADPPGTDPAGGDRASLSAGGLRAGGTGSGLPDGGTGALGAPGGPAGAFGGGTRRPAAGALAEEHLALLDRCGNGPISVAELAAEADLPLCVVRVLLGDLIDLGRIRVICPVSPAELPDVGLLHQLIAGLKSL